jgi:DnaJ-class molecular chaperone
MRDTNAESTESIDGWIARDKQETAQTSADEAMGVVVLNTCPQCLGDGSVEWYEDEYTAMTRYHRCDLCRGNGTI